MANKIIAILTWAFLNLAVYDLSFSANISIEADLLQSGGKYFIKIVNKSSVQFSMTSLGYYFNGEQYAMPLQTIMSPNETRNIEIPVAIPSESGSYNLLAILNYLNENETCSVLADKIFTFGNESLIKPEADINFNPIFKEGRISVKINNNDGVTAVKAFFPDQLQVVEISTDRNIIDYKLLNKTPSMNNTANAYFIFERPGIVGNTPVHSAGYLSKNLKMGPFYTILNQSIVFWFIATPVFLLICALIFAAGYFYREKGNSKNGELIQYVSLILLIAFFTHFFVYNYPFNTFWDENYHVASAQKYINHVMFMEPHPPLGKMLIALGEVILNPNRGIDTSSFLTTDYIKTFPDGYSFLGVRFIPTLLSVLSCVVFFLILYFLSNRLQYSFLFSSFFLFDNGIILHTRSAMLEGTQLFFILLTILYFIILFQKNEKIKIYEYLFLGLLTGLSLSVKLNSMVLLLLFVFLAFKEHIDTIVKLPWKIFVSKKTDGQEIKNFLYSFFDISGTIIIKGGAYLAGAISVFLIVYYIHFAIGEKVIAGRFYRATNQYKQVIDSGQTANPLNFFIMFRDNLEFIHNYEKGVPKWDPTKKDENGSPAFSWPFGYKSINYRWEKSEGKVAYYYFQGNPVIWWTALAGFILSGSLIIGRFIFGIKNNGSDKFNLILVFMLLYCAYMAAVLQITRVMYLYHYIIPLIFSIILFYLVFLYLFKDLIEKNDKLLYYAVVLLVTEVFAAYLFFGPLTYGLPVSAVDFTRRIWTKVWDLRYIYF